MIRASQGRPHRRAVNTPGSPRAAGRLLEFCVPGPAGAALLGDLEEEFAETILPQCGAGPARRWYWSQVLRSLWPALTLHVHGKSLGRLVGAVLLGITVLWVLGDLAMTAALAGLTAAWPSDPAPGPLLEGAYLLGLVPASILAGYAAAWHGRHNGVLAALALAGFVALPVIVVTITGAWTPPYWSHAVWFVVGPLGVVVGAQRCARRHRAA